ncbi:MAG: serine hydrolase domain-containing protein [Bacteroidota bacterium]
MRYLFSLFLLCFCLASGPAQVLEHLKKQVDKIIYYDTSIDRKKIPGFVIAIQLGDSTYIWGNGQKNWNNELPPDENTVFEIGGLTKVFTASLVQLLVEEKRLHYDSTVNSYLPECYQNPKAEHLKLKDLVQHSSGIPRMPLEFGLKEKEANNPYAYYTEKDLMEFYKDFYLSPEDSGAYLYSHVNYALLEYIIEQQSQKSFESLLNSKLFQPLGMSSTWIENTPEESSTNIAEGHSLSGQPTPMWTFQSFRASEGIKSNAVDLIQFMRSNLGHQPEHLAKSFAQNHSPVIDTKMRYKTFGANGWHVMKIKKYHDVIVHAGSTDGYRAFMGFVKEADNGVVLLSNSELSMSGLGLLILRMINHNWKKKKKRYK